MSHWVTSAAPRWTENYELPKKSEEEEDQPVRLEENLECGLLGAK